MSIRPGSKKFNGRLSVIQEAANVLSFGGIARSMSAEKRGRFFNRVSLLFYSRYKTITLLVRSVRIVSHLRKGRIDASTFA
jgi:hypothetical protein